MAARGEVARDVEHRTGVDADGRGQRQPRLFRIRLGEPSVLKFEGRFVDANGTSHHQEYAAQWAFTF